MPHTMTKTHFPFVTIFLLLTQTQATPGTTPQSVRTSFTTEELTTRSHFLIWERCEDRRNDRKNSIETCCRGNYRCTHKYCQSHSACKFRFLKTLLWCYHNTCPPRRSSKASPSKSPTPSQKQRPSPQAKPSQTARVTPSPTPSSRATKSPTRTPGARESQTPAPISPGTRCENIRQRREIRDLTAEQRADWQSAFLDLHHRDASGTSEWDRLVETHMRNSDEAHGGAYFLPWHRLYLDRVENAIRKTRPNFTLPYWDWSVDAHDAALAVVWRWDFAGGAQRGNAPITSGLFAGLEARYPTPHTVRRDFTAGQSGEIGTLWNSHALRRLIEEDRWSRFANGMEAAHALLHIYMGGDMANSHSAPNDPMFFLHHAFVDMLYARRQTQRGIHEFSGTHDFARGTLQASPNWVFNAFGVPVRSAFHAPCVQYVPSGLVGRSRAGEPRQSGHMPADVCRNERFLRTRVLSRDRCADGESALRHADASSA